MLVVITMNIIIISRTLNLVTVIIINTLFQLTVSLCIRVLLVVMLCVGMLLGNDNNLPLICSLQWLIMGLLSYFMFLYFISSSAVIGGLMTFFHLMTLWPQLYYRLTECIPSVVLPVAMVTYLMALFVSRVYVGVGVLKYAVVCAMILQWYGLRRWLPLGVRLGKVKVKMESCPQRRPSYTMMVGHMIRRLSTVFEQEEEEEEGEIKKHENNIHQKMLQELLIGQEAEIKHFEVKKLRKRKSLRVCGCHMTIT